jgi:DDE superfamily endonuclease/Helix-turn-helix of DDE superfamily endonuclease
VHHTTGFDREEIIDLCIRINSVQPGAGSPNWPPCLGLFKSVVAALTYMRHNRTQAEIGESLGVSQPTISRAISAVTPLVPEATREFVPTADDLDPDAQYILDGTLLPCWSWDGHKELYSGKHKTTGMNLQVACTIYGKLAWISDPVNGSRHDNYCREESGVLLTINPRNWIGDKGYIGNNMITPFRKPAGIEPALQRTRLEAILAAYRDPSAGMRPVGPVIVPGSLATAAALRFTGGGHDRPGFSPRRRRRAVRFAHRAARLVEPVERRRQRRGRRPRLAGNTWRSPMLSASTSPMSLLSPRPREGRAWALTWRPGSSPAGMSCSRGRRRPRWSGPWQDLRGSES